jgi:hypothetical protein
MSKVSSRPSSALPTSTSYGYRFNVINEACNKFSSFQNLERLLSAEPSRRVEPLCPEDLAKLNKKRAEKHHFLTSQSSRPSSAFPTSPSYGK